MPSKAFESERPKVVWAPHHGSQTLFLTCPIREVILEGTRGGGKTDALLMDFAQHCGRGFGAAWRGVLFRLTYPQLADVVAKSKRWFRQIFPGARFNASDYVWTWPDGEQLLLRHFGSPDDYWNYHGHEYPWVGWEELTSWPSIDCYDSMFACNRSSHPGVPRKVRGTTNPYGVGHNWVKAYIIDPAPAGRVIEVEREIPTVKDGQLAKERVKVKRLRLHSSYLENPALLNADPMYLANIEKISDPNKRRAWLFGDWNITSGGMFDDLWDANVHVLKPFEIPRGWRIDRAFDWGSSRPFSVGWWAESDGSPVRLADGRQRTFARGTLIRIDEWYGCTGKPNEGLRLTASKVAQGIVEREIKHGWRDATSPKKAKRVHPGPADSSIYDVTDDKSIAENMAAEGVTWKAADKRPGSRKNGWELIRTRLEAAAEGNEKPGVFVFDTCKDFIRTLPSIPRDEGNPDDVDTAAEDHVADETRYRVLGPLPEAKIIDIGFAS